MKNKIKKLPTEYINEWEEFRKIGGGIGNSNIAFWHIKKLEERIESDTRQRIDLVTHTDFYCWLVLYVNDLIVRVENLYYRKGNSRKQKIDYKELLKQFIKDLKQEGSAIDDDEIYAVLELRHSLFHHGVPNLIREQYKNQPKNVKRIVEKCLTDYQYSKRVFDELKKLIDAVPKQQINFNNIAQIGN